LVISVKFRKHQGDHTETQPLREGGRRTNAGLDAREQRLMLRQKDKNSRKEVEGGGEEE